ncbi:Txe/YoeB family addiction module toxin [Dyadobacter sp. BHUBP1]|uniref:Txe/YoeB family addiction module toxin n=1 Tax=Dyadobacter sp. BHUBP1 TaxID=3424178 RepID=UPI003D349CE2
MSFWHKSGNKIIIKKIEQLIEAIADTPTEGIGKPELLKYELAEKYFRRISHEHRIVYEIVDQTIYILSLKGLLVPIFAFQIKAIGGIAC